MAFFKMRKGGDDTAASSRQPESVEAMRKRARHRLIGAGVLVLAGVIGFPLLFDTQPRPIAVDIPIEIPDRNKAKPLPAAVAPAPAPAVVSAPVAQAPATSGTVTPAPAAAPAPAPVPAVKAEAPPPPVKSEPPKVEAKAEPKPDPVVEAKPAAKPEPKPNDGARALALLEGKAASAAAGDGRFVVQVGAFTDNAKARETRQRVERAGLKTYTHVAETKDGQLTRVRVGPFASKAEADKAAEKIKTLDLDPRVLKL